MQDLMKIALNEARKALSLDEVPIGACIVKDNKILAVAHNQTIEKKNPLLHAEIVAINQALDAYGYEALNGASIFITIEPCAMCAQAISYLRFNKIIYGASNEKFGAIENGVRLFNQKNASFIPEIYDGIAEQEARELMQSYFRNLRM